MAAPDNVDDAVYGAVAGETEAFKQAILAKYKSVCQIDASRPHSFDWDKFSSSTATAFYVDDVHGFVLTNKHVAGPGPFWGNLIFGSNVEFTLKLRYSDPEADFSILQVNDLEQVRALGIEAIKLAPEKAKPGVEIRLLSNEVGTKLSMTRAVLSRIDVTPPYGNTTWTIKIMNSAVYFASLSAVGGSSGGPALDSEGDAVALQVGGIANSSVNYLLPLHYPKLALQRLRDGLPIVRGTIQVKWDLKPLHECRRLGLSATWEEKIRAAGVSYAISADVVLAGGPADGKLQVGDILLEVDDELYVDLFQLSRHMDEHVDKEIRIRVCRASELVDVTCLVGDLHAIVPHQLITRFGVTFHPLSWQVAVAYRTRIEGIFVTGYPMTSALTSGRLLESINGMPTRNMEQLSEALDKLGPGHCYITTVQKRLGDPTTPIVTTAFLPIDHSGRSVEMWREPREGGGWKLGRRWDFDNVRHTEPVLSQESTGPGIGSIVPKNADSEVLNNIFRSIVNIESYTFASVGNNTQYRSHCWGIVFDVERGLVFAPRHFSCLFTDVTVNFANCVDIRGRVVFENLLANFVIVQYDPVGLPKELEMEAFRLGERALRVGDKVYYMALNSSEDKRSFFTQVEARGQHTIDSYTSRAFLPFYHETISLQAKRISTNSSGVVLFEDGSLAGLKVPWTYTDSAHKQYVTDCFIPASRLEAIITLQKAGQLDDVRWQDFDVKEIPLADAVRRGVPQETLAAVNKHSPTNNKKMLVVDKVPSHCCVDSDGKKEPHPLERGDIILEMDGEPVVMPADLKYMFTKPHISLRVQRGGKELSLEVPTVSAEQVQVDEFVEFCGATFHRPTLSIRANLHPCHSEVYLSTRTDGSPAQIFGLRGPCFVTKVNGQAIVTMDDFKRAIATIPDETDSILSVWESNCERVVTVKLNTPHWPSFSLTRDKPLEKGTWTRVYL